MSKETHVIIFAVNKPKGRLLNNIKKYVCVYFERYVSILVKNFTYYFIPDSRFDSAHFEMLLCLVANLLCPWKLNINPLPSEIKQFYVLRGFSALEKTM